MKAFGQKHSMFGEQMDRVKFTEAHKETINNSNLKTLRKRGQGQARHEEPVQ